MINRRTYQNAAALGIAGFARPGRQDCWIKVKNPAAPARREAEEDWG